MLQCYDFWNTVMLNCEAGGTVILFAAGNEGPGASTLRSPAIYSINDWQMFSVGAVDGTTNPTPPFPIACFPVGDRPRVLRPAPTPSSRKSQLPV